MSVCDAWVPRAAAEPLVFLILEAVGTGKPATHAAEEIDGRLRADLGQGWTGDVAMIARGIRRVRAKRRADRALRWLGPRLARRMPASFRGSLAGIYRPLARHLAAAGCRRRYGRRFVSKIDEEDDLLHYGLDVARATEPAFRYYRAAESYFGGGEWNATQVVDTFADVGCSLRGSGSFLEFACGYGRLTRHFVHLIGPSKITVSDIDRRAVAFVTAKLGVRGFPSARTPEELTHDARYDVIAVISLFSHLPMEHWGPWLRRMSQMLNAGGFMLFSVLGMHAWDINVTDARKEAFQVKADGFLYGEWNETRGRLSTEDYGMSYVSERFVERLVADNFAGRVVKSAPRGLNDFQDVYVLQAS